MPIWPFGRKNRRSSLAQSTADQEKSIEASYSPNYPRNATPRAPPSSSHDDDTPRKRRRSSERPQHLHRDPEKNLIDYEKSRTPRQRGSRQDITALPGVKRLERSPHLRQASMHNPAVPYTSDSAHAPRSVQGELGKHPASSASTPQKRRLSKRQEHLDRALREEEIRAMSAPVQIPKRQGGHGDMLRRDSKKARRAFSKGHNDSRGSTVSLPFQESIHSSMSGVSEQRGWEVSGLDFLNPRPTVRLSHGGAQSASFSGGIGLSRDSSKKGKLPVLKEGAKRKDRRKIAELADDLDAGDLRMLMDRDSRRKDKKRQYDQEKLERTLRQKADKQRLEDERRAREINAPPPSAVHPAFRSKTEEKLPASEATIGQAPPTPTSIKDERREEKKEATYLDYTSQQDPFEDPEANPFNDNAHEESEHAERSYSPMATPAETLGGTILETPMEDPVLETAQAIRMSQGRLSVATNSPPQSPVHAAQSGQLSPLRREYTPDIPVMPPPPPMEQRRASDSAAKKPGTWASIFRRGGPSARTPDAHRASASDASFSNTSRESMARQPIPAHLVGTMGTVSKRRSGTPVRTQSIFREDLPELSTSPPESRVQSPDVTLMAAQAAAQRRIKGTGSTSSFVQPRGATPDPSGAGRTDSAVENDGRNSAMAMSTSLASIGSEGSWLTGRPSKRRSGQSQLRSSVGSLAKRRDDFSGSYEDLGMPEEEYFRRLTPNPATEGQDEGGAPEEIEHEEDGGVVRHGTNRRRPTLVERDPRIKSREGLLSEFNAGQAAAVEEDASEAGATPTESEASPERDQLEGQQIEVGRGHARQFSSGSAKLLNIPPSRNRSGRSSPDTRLSQASPTMDTPPGQPSPRL